MKEKSFLSILFDLAVLIVLAWATIHYMHKLDAATESNEILRNGFTSVICMIALAGTCMMQRLEHFFGDK
jgi:hypothetical protein